MLKIYTDAAFDRKTGYAAYCILVIHDQIRDYTTTDIDDCNSPNEAELAGVFAALELVKKTGKSATIYCDNKDAIKKARLHAPANVRVEYIRAHQVGGSAPISDNIKYQHWADTMARGSVKRRLDQLKTEAYNKEAKET